MPETNISSAAITSLSSGVADFSVSAKSIDDAGTGEVYWDNKDWAEHYGYYSTIPELRQSINALAMWTAGKGWTADARTTLILENIIGWGEDSWDSLMQNMLIVKKVNGDSYAEIMRDDEGELINLKPLNPANVRVVVGKDGLIKRYEHRTAEKTETFKTFEILHLSNDRVASEIHGTSVVGACKWIIDARNEAMSDWRKMLHRNLLGIRIIEVDEDNVAKLAQLSAVWKEAISKNEVLILPKGSAQFPQTNVQNPETWIRYLENIFYMAVGVPRIILGGADTFTEASSKVGYMTFEQVYMTEQRLLEQDLWNQLAIDITFIRPVSMKEDMQSSEAANTGQVGIQPNETTTQAGRTE